MSRLYVCSPYSGDVARNTAIAKALCRIAIGRFFAPFAPHLFYTRFVDDSDPLQREMGRAAGLMFLETCDELWAFVERGRERPSAGMQREINFARDRGIRVEINPTFFRNVQYRPPGGGPLAWAYADPVYEQQQQGRLNL